MANPAREAAALGRFLRSRRGEAVPPTDARNTTRRVQGLRRAEVAAAAGVSVGYYIRLEQGRGGWVSEGVLVGLTRALQLDPAAAAHLRALAHPSRRSESAPESVSRQLSELVDALAPLPALVLGRATDLLCWNRQAHALLADHVPFAAPASLQTRPNWATLLFLDPAVRGRFVDWPSKAADTVADLRMISGREPGDQRLQSVIDDLCVTSPDFLRLWSSHVVTFCDQHLRDYAHPAVGALRLSDALFDVPDKPGQRLVIFTAEAGSDSANSLALLGSASPC